MHKGQRIVLVSTTDEHTMLRPGDEGTVSSVDGLGTVHVDWDSGSTLGLVPDEDTWDELEPTALAWTSDEEVEEGARKFREQWPDKWEAWLRWQSEDSGS